MKDGPLEHLPARLWWVLAALTIPRDQWRRLALIAFFNITCWNILVVFGLAHIPSGRAAILAFTMPAWAIPLSVLILGERITARKLVTSVSVTVFSLSMLVIPVVGVFSGILFLGERPGWPEFAALAFVLGSLATVVMPQRKN